MSNAFAGPLQVGHIVVDIQGSHYKPWSRVLNWPGVLLASLGPKKVGRDLPTLGRYLQESRASRCL
jgi:hypothetical protein